MKTVTYILSVEADDQTTDSEIFDELRDQLNHPLPVVIKSWELKQTAECHQSLGTNETNKPQQEKP